MSLEIINFGCRLNAAESEVMRREAAAAGLANTVIVNSCAVTAEAVSKTTAALPGCARLPTRNPAGTASVVFFAAVNATSPLAPAPGLGR